MVGTGFVVAMEASISRAGYNTPAGIYDVRREWIIVSCWGADSEYLSISCTFVAADQQGDAPDGLQPKATFLGLLASRSAADHSSVYLMVRHLPNSVPVAGVFHPTDGYARAIWTDDMLSVSAAGRHAHSVGQIMGTEVRTDVPNPAAGAAFANAWHIGATRRPWIGEFIASGAHAD
jgi:hypothetical protein